MILAPLGPQLKRVFEITPKEYSFVVASYTIFASISSFIGAYFLDKFDRKKLLLYSYLGFSIGTFICGFAPSYFTLLLSRSITGIFGGMVGTLVFALIADLVPLERRGQGVGIVMSAFAVASVIGVPFSLLLANTYSWRHPFFVLGSTGLLLLYIAWRFLPSVSIEKSESNFKNTIINNFTDKNAIKAFILTALLVLGQFSIIPFISIYMTGNVCLTEKELTYIYIVGGALTVFTTPFIGKLSDKYGRHKIFTIAAIVSIIPIFLITNMPPIPLPFVLMTTGIFFIFISGRMIPATAMITSAVSKKTRGSFMSFRTSIQNLTASFASLIPGFLTFENEDKFLNGFHYVGYIAIFFTVLAIFFSVKLVEKE